MPAKAKMYTKVSAMQRPTAGCRRARRSAVGSIDRRLAAESGRRVSGRKRHASRKFRKESPAATQMGTARPNCESPPPSAGPKVKPTPNAAPMRPMPRARVSGVVRSAMQAWAMAMLAVKTPCSPRNRNSIHRALDEAKPASITPVISTESTSVGRRPQRSLACPQSGAKKNWASE